MESSQGRRIMTLLRNTVLLWTIVTTTFFWTTTMRLVLKPEISQWRIFGVGGQGMAGEYWLPPLVALVALAAFYLEGRGRLRPLFHGWLVAWHLALTGLCLYGALQVGGEISFGTWGITLSFWWLVAPFAIFLVLASWLVVHETRFSHEVPQYSWHQLNLKPLVLAVALLPVAILLFKLGEGFDGWVKLAVATTIVQWVLLVEGVARPASPR
jgi:hypothetical protein